MNWELEERERGVAVNKLLWRTDVGELPHYSVAWSHAHTHTRMLKHTHCKTQWGERKAKQPCWSKFLGWPRWLWWALRRRAKLGEKPYQILKQRAAACGSFILRCGSAGMLVLREPRRSQRTRLRGLIYPRPVQDGGCVWHKAAASRFQISSVSGLRFCHASKLTLHPEQAASIVHLSAEGGTLT